METKGTNRASRERSWSGQGRTRTQNSDYKARSILAICLGVIVAAACIWGVAFAISNSASPQNKSEESQSSASAGIVSAISASAQSSTDADAKDQNNPDDSKHVDGETPSSDENEAISVAGDGSDQGTPGTQSETSDQNAQNAIPGQGTSSDPRLAISDSKNTVKPKEHAVYLTFDDGPSDLTPSILKTLEKNGVKATWFVSGSHSNLDMLPKIWDAGHQVALHTNSHNYKKIYKNKNAFFKDMDKIAKKVESRIGVSPTLIRFPGGSINSYNKKSIKKIKRELRERNWHYFDWNASIDDAVSIKMRSPKSLLKSCKRTSKGEHSVCLLMHDTNAKKTTAKALDSIIKYYKKNGYEFKYLTADSYGYHFGS